jgi:hypothetical protein
MVPNVTVFEVIKSHGHALTFIKQLTRVLLHDFNDLSTCIQQIHLIGDTDHVN